MAWLDPQWPDRDQAYQEQLEAQGRPRPPDTPANRISERVGLVAMAIVCAVLIGAFVTAVIVR